MESQLRERATSAGIVVIRSFPPPLRALYMLAMTYYLHLTITIIREDFVRLEKSQIIENEFRIRSCQIQYEGNFCGLYAPALLEQMELYGAYLSKSVQTMLENLSILSLVFLIASLHLIVGNRKIHGTVGVESEG
ncbi:hypothetical protein D9611_001720 [Ephemerocybe angulata]|uniref:Uncharacterized protein n=1 Tax=Ephemerocybe angulata TaxID=980116 RepID=A0A8H5FLQ2_9AGAR|nr:hypothetical protein D9611_001720 [Tulosesus angulatus]